MLHYSSITCLLALLCNQVVAWTTQKSPLLASSLDNPSSRRDWISSTVTTAAGVSLFPLPSFAAKKPKIMTSDATCDQAVSILQRKDRLLYVLGTAHISEVSAQLAQQLVKDVKPDAVFIELDLKRVGGLPFNKIQRKKDRWVARLFEPTRSSDVSVTPFFASPNQVSDPFVLVFYRIEIPGPNDSTVIVPNIIPVSKTMQFSPSQQQAVLASLMDAIDFGVSDEYNRVLASLLIGASNPGAGISQMYSNLSKQGFKPGQEFVVAVKEGQNIGADIVLGDQDMGVTMQRLAQAAQMTDYSKMQDPNSQFEQSMKELAPEESKDYKVRLDECSIDSRYSLEKL